MTLTGPSLAGLPNQSHSGPSLLCLKSRILEAYQSHERNLEVPVQAASSVLIASLTEQTKSSLVEKPATACCAAVCAANALHRCC